MSIGYLQQYLYIILFYIICVMGFYLQYLFLSTVCLSVPLILTDHNLSSKYYGSNLLLAIGIGKRI